MVIKLLRYVVFVKLNITWLVFNLVSVFCGNAQTNSPIIQDLISGQSLRGAAIGLVVTDLHTGLILMEKNPDMLLAPASVVKLITTAAAIEMLGADHRFETGLAYTGLLNNDTRVLHGDLLVVGGGDPTTGSVWYNAQRTVPDIFVEWVDRVKDEGISAILGDIVVDIELFERWSLPSSWAWEDIGNYYGAGPSAVNLYDNTVKLFFKSPSTPGEITSIEATYPTLPGAEWINEVRSSSVNRDLAYIYGSPWDRKRLVRGTIPVNRSRFEVKASMPDPPLVFGNLLKERLISSGIEVKGRVRLSKEKSAYQSLHTFVSPPLAVMCSVLNHESVNLIAEALVVQLALTEKGFGSHKNGLEAIGRFMKQRVTDDPFFMEDGSGLSRFNAFTAHQINDLLISMHQSTNSRVFKSTLPVAGAGTLRSFNTQKFPGYTLRCKSGSMTRVRAYAGFLICQTGREVAFTVMVNNFPGTHQEVFRSIEKFLWGVRNEF
jgi:D-alanyl-D-alanine carboxypeptidase/D-alanyl-D-alanine-endopeptidase (penicillin-binding protein 4)